MQQVGKDYWRKTAVHDISFVARGGDCVGLFGINGAGKTTILKLVCGLLTPTDGKINRSTEFCSLLSDKQTFPSWAKAKDVRLLLSSLYSNFNAARYEQLLEELNVPRRDVSKLSKGELQKLKLCATLSVEAGVYAFDEPLSGIDIVSRQKIIETIKNSITPNTACIVSTHEIKDIAPLLSRVLILDKRTISKNMAYRHDETEYAQLVESLSSLECVERENLV